jgi:hypothetical protein
MEIGPSGSGVEMSGFIDIAFTDQADTSQLTDIGQVEFMFDYSTGPVSASIDVDFGGNNAGAGSHNGGNLEEAIITYDFGNGFSVTAGKMLTYMGFEAYDPTNMYQYSYAYDYGNYGVQTIYDAYDVGVSVDYGTDDYSIGVWSSAENSAGYELALAYTGIENFTAKAIWSDFSDQVGGPSYEKATYWVSYQFGSLLLAAEIAEADFQSDADTPPNSPDKDGFLVMANYAFTDSAALTLRVSTEETSDWDSETLTSDITKFTISPSYIFTDNLSGLIEFSTYDEDITTVGGVDYDGDGVGDGDLENLLAVELIYTF